MCFAIVGVLDVFAVCWFECGVPVLIDFIGFGCLRLVGFGALGSDLL